MFFKKSPTRRFLGFWVLLGLFWVFCTSTARCSPINVEWKNFKENNDVTIFTQCCNCNFMNNVLTLLLVQGAYKSGKPGNLREFCKSGKLREFEMYRTQGIFGAHYYQRQKCRPMTLVSENIRFMQIFAGVPLGGGRQTTFGIVQEICQNDCYCHSLHRVFAL